MCVCVRSCARVCVRDIGWGVSGKMVLQIQTLRNPMPGGTWVAQSVECLTLDFGSGHDLMVVRSSPTSGSILTAWSLLGILSLSLSLSLPLLCSLCLSK